MRDTGTRARQLILAAGLVICSTAMLTACGNNNNAQESAGPTTLPPRPMKQTPTGTPPAGSTAGATAGATAGTTAGATAGATAGGSATGGGAEALFTQNCGRCHRAGSLGSGRIDLSHIGAQRDASWISTQIRNPAAHHSRMPAFGPSQIPEAQLKTLADWLAAKK